MKARLARWWDTIRVYFGFAPDPAYIGEPIETLWSPR